MYCESKDKDSEVAKAQVAKKKEETIFDKIIQKKIPATILHEDELCLAFKDINPQAPVHFLVIPKRRIDMMQNVQAKHKAILGHLMFTAAQVAAKQGLDKNGYRIVVNNGRWGCQSVFHIHLHVLGGRQMYWPPG